MGHSVQTPLAAFNRAAPDVPSWWPELLEWAREKGWPFDHCPSPAKPTQPDHVTQQGFALVMHFEGAHRRMPDGRIEAYLDTLTKPNVWTIGYGHTGLVHRDGTVFKGRIITQSEAQELLRQDMANSCDDVRNAVDVDLTAYQLDALVSFVFNLGIGNFRSSTLLKKLNRGDTQGAADEFPRWRRSGGVIRAGLVRRRKAERHLFLTGQNHPTFIQ